MGGGAARFSGFNSQVISSVLLSAPLARNDTVIAVEKPLEKPYLRMTLNWMKKFGVELTSMSSDYTRFEISGGKTYRAVEAAVPADWSGAAFPLVAAACTPSELTISGLDFNDAQGDKIVVDHLVSMGADITKDTSGGRLLVRGGKPLRGGAVIDLNDIPDSLPALSAAACFAQGDTVFTGIAHVRVKETDRVAVMKEALSKIGAKVEISDGGMIVHGDGGKNLKGAVVESHDDHRIAMAMAAAGLFSAGETRVKDAECASVSFPGFFDAMNRAGAAIELRD
jgi:3-phosphoshikimate 1-carboxyvinyltransferase